MIENKFREEAVRSTREKAVIHEWINFDKTPENPVKVSIVVPVCNVERYLRECMESCVNQTLRDIEIICVNDGSTDHCLEILKEYAAKDDRVKVIDKDNAGYGHTMNLGMDMAQGEYAAIVESDDFIAENMYERLYETAKKKDVDLVKADFYRVYESDGTYKLKYVKTARNDYMYNRVINRSDGKYYLEAFRAIMNTWSGIYRRSFLVENNIRHHETPGASFQDNGFYFKTFSYAESILFMNEGFYRYRMDNPDSSSNNKGKVDAHKLEFGLLKEYIDQNHFDQIHQDLFYWKKYNSYIYNYQRIADEYKREYLHSISKEFQEELDAGKISSEVFYYPEIDEIEWIADSPDDYYEQHSEDSIKVSVVIPVFNSSQYLRECMDSVINQTLEEIEIICVDDGSDDDSLDILRGYEETDSRVKVLAQEHRGGGAARNRGLEIARGVYLSFLDSDDFFEPDMLESIYERCSKMRADICVFQVKNYDDATKKVTSDTNSFVAKNIPKKDFFHPSELKDKIFGTFQTWAWNKLFRRHFIEKEGIRFQEIYRTNDMYFVNTALMKAKRITVLARELIYYRRNTMVNCQATNHVSPEDFFLALMALQEEIGGFEENEKLKASFENLVVKSCVYNLNSQKQAASFYQLYVFLHTEGLRSGKIDLASFDEAHIEKQNRHNFYECLKILDASFEEYMFEKLTYHRSNSENNKKVIRQLEEKVKKKSAEVEEVKKLRGVDHRLSHLENEFNSLKISAQQKETYQMELILTRASMTYKIGRFITWLPRTVRELLQKKGK